MAIYELSSERIDLLQETTFQESGVRERDDLQRLLRQQIEVISPNTLVIDEEFKEWDSNRRMDLLGVDRSGNLVVIELKRTGDGGHMELQAIRYAAMVSTLTFNEAVEIYQRYLDSNDEDGDARDKLLTFLRWGEPNDDEFAQQVQIVLVSADFSKEVTNAVLWLNENSLNIRCVRIKPYTDGSRLFVDVQQLIPLPEAADYQVARNKKAQKQRADASRTWSYEEFCQEIERLNDQQARYTAEALHDWADNLGADIFLGKGMSRAAMIPTMKFTKSKVDWYYLFRVWPDGTIVVPTRDNREKPAIASNQAVDTLLHELNRISGGKMKIGKPMPRFHISALATEVTLRQFKQAYEVFIEAISTHYGSE